MKRKTTILTVAFVLLAFLALPMGMRGQTTVTFIAGTDTGETSVTKDGVTVSMSTMSRTDNYRCYANTAMTIASTAGNITNVELTCTGSGNSNYGPGKFSLTNGYTGTYTFSGYIGTWVGSAGEISLTASAQVRMTQIVVTIGGAAPTTFTVTYDCNGGTSGCPENETDITAGTSITLAAAPTKTDYTFDGWNDGITTYQAGASYTVNSNVTMTAQWTEIVSGDDQWVLTNLADLTEDDVFVIVGNGYAMTNNNGTDSAPAPYAVTISGNEITSPVYSTLKWTVSGNATNGYTFYPNGSTETWLYCSTTSSSGNNDNMRVGTGNRKVFELASNKIKTKDTNTARYLSLYTVNGASTPQDWRGYVNTTTAPDIQFYKKVTGGVLPPSITADDVDITYDATSGSIAYTIDNPVTGGTVTVATESDWLTLGQGTTSPITFTCSANEGAAERTATVTLTYTYDRTTATANVTVTQAGNPNIVDNISDINATGTDYVVRGTVVAANARGFVIGDGTGYVYTYLNAAPNVAVGDIKKISGTMGSHNNVYQFTSAANIENATNSNYDNTPAIQVLDATGIGTYSQGLHLSDYVQIEGTLTISTNNNNTTTYYNIAIANLGTSASISYPTSDQSAALTALANKYVVVKGYFAGVSSGHFNIIMESVVEVTVPVITVPNATVNDVPVEGAEGTIDVLYYNFTDLTANIFFCNADGGTATYDWIDAEVNDDDDIAYTVSANNGEARTAYLKVYSGNVYSNIVTINQAAYVAPTYADLPFSFDGGKADIANTDGLYQEGLGDDYNNSPYLRFDGADDYVLLQFEERPGILTFDIKGNGSGSDPWAGVFKLMVSNNGSTFVEKAVYETGDLTSTKTTMTIDDLASEVRYIMWIYTTKTIGNVALGNIELQPYVAPQQYTLTVSSLSNVELFVFDANDESQAIIEGQGSAQVLSGTAIEISVSAMEGYALQSLMVDGVDVTSQIDETGVYTFTMPSHNVTVTATAVEQIVPSDGDYVRITSLDQLTNGSIVVIASRYNTDATNYYAMKNTISSGKAQGVTFVSTTSNGNEILPATIVDEEDDYYWVVNLTEDGYTFTNADGDVISYNSSSNFNMNGANTTWNIERNTSGAALVPYYEGFKIINGNSTNRCIAFRNTGVFGPYSTQNINDDEYNFFLDFFVQTAASETVTQTINLTAGWNWFSTYIDMDAVELLEMFEEGLGEDAIQIKSKTKATAWDEDEEEWSGGLQTTGLTNDLTYMVQLPANTTLTVTLEGPAVATESCTINLQPGWNWIGFPSAVELDVNEALANFEAMDGDQLKTRNQATAWDEDEEEWSGSLNTLVPGQGLMFYSAATDEVRTLVFNAGSSKGKAAK